MEKRDILSMSEEELCAALEKMSQPKYRARQIFSWLHASMTDSFDKMTNIPKALRETLNDNFVIFGAAIEKKLVSEYDDTVKYLFALNDSQCVETVLMKYKYGYTVCVSTQVGCNMGCRFCASTLDGCQRNLAASEILAQVYAASRDCGERISHIVLMGMGEPLDNFTEVMRFISLVTDERGQNISMRHISLSTCGIVPRIYELAKMKLQLTLSVSLHAPTDEIRSSMMPVNKRWGVDELLEACREYARLTGRRISFEYAMVHGVNDSDLCAHALADKLSGMLCHVNLIPVNEVRETGMVKSKRERIDAFSRILAARSIAVTVRRRLGSDINASCGQLRRSTVKGSQ